MNVKESYRLEQALRKNKKMMEKSPVGSNLFGGTVDVVDKKVLASLSRKYAGIHPGKSGKGVAEGIWPPRS
jgi:hypothetical protein